MTVDRGKKAKRQGQIGMNTRYKNERESGKKAGERDNEDKGQRQEGQGDRARRAGDRIRGAGGYGKKGGTQDKRSRRIRQERWETG